MKLTENFTAHEVTHSDYARRQGINNKPKLSGWLNAMALAVRVLQPLRFELGIPVLVSSWYRSDRVNEMAGGAHNSQHKKGEAADIYSETYTPEALAKVMWIMGLPVDQVIIYPGGGFVHVSHKRLGEQRGEYLIERGGNLVPWRPKP